MKQVIAMENDITIKIDGGGIAFSLRAREYKDPQCVVYEDINREEILRVVRRHDKCDPEE